MVEHLTSAEFKNRIFDFSTKKDWEYKGELPAIIDFYADWCGPCKMVAPILETLSGEYEGKLKIYKVNTDEEQEVSAAFGIQSIPSILFIPSSGQPQMAMGALPRSAFQKAIKDVLGVPAQA